MNVLITGAHGFVGKNLTASLKSIRDGKDKTTGLTPDLNIWEYDVNTERALLNTYCAKADFVCHLAGINRPDDPAEFMAGNFGFTSELLNALKKYGNNCPVMLASSAQAVLDNPYGQSKKAGEELLFSYGEETGAKVLIYRFPNVFGKWCRPNYNSAVATFCHNVANNLPIVVNDRAVHMKLVYIDDVVGELISAMQGQESRSGQYCVVPVEQEITLGEVADLISSFRSCRENLDIPDLSNAFVRKLYATYLSYLPTDKFAYPLRMNMDQRGSFTEIFRTADRGQISVNISKPGIRKGNHWHHTKTEKFLVVSGKGVIRFRKIGTQKIYEYSVAGDKLEVVDIPAGYTHNIENLSDTDMVTIMWCAECFDPEHPDTYFEEV